MLSVKAAFKKHIAAFDGKPFLKPCAGLGCNKVAMRASVYMDNVSSPRFWCADCDPHQTGANPGKLQMISTYGDILFHVSHYCSRKKPSFNSLIKSISQAKGMGARATDAELQKLFS